MIRTFAALAAAIALAGCGDSKAPPGAREARGAEGQIQGGTISDAMIPLDALTSQSPPMEPLPSSEGDDQAVGESPTAATPDDNDAATPDPSPSPVQTPTPEPAEEEET